MVTDELVIRTATPSDLVTGTELLADSLGFAAADRIPPWLAQDAQEGGAILLAAVSGSELVGFSLALPALAASGDAEMFSCGLVVAPGHRRRGIGRSLKLEQGRRALDLGIRTIRWRADPLNAAGLHLYLDGLGARVVGYRTELYAGVRDDGAVPHDDVEIEWRLDQASTAPMTASQLVELPPKAASLESDEARHRWRLAVREQVVEALGSGSVGVGVDRDARSGRAWMRFEVDR
jgi:predicted GNAT superfamily acetyltransferase